jgi:NAD(P)-dependent dehydrogenase (short-subunit alcohol dehydrogenase family)
MRPRELLDDGLDVLVLPSFTRIGPAVRSRLFRWQAPDLTGRRVAVTGPTSGLGLAAVHQMARAGADVVLLARNPERAARVAADLAHCGTEVTTIELDLASLASADEAGGRLAELDRLDALVNNGGGLHTARMESADRIELTLATHVVAPFLLTARALPALERAAEGRIITVTSGGMYTQRLHLDDLQTTRGYQGPTAYGRSKRAQVVLTGQWAERLAARGSAVTAHAMHPGWARTPGLAEALPRFERVLSPLLRSPDQGADTITWLCGAPAAEIGRGRLWLDRRPRPTVYRPGTGTSPTEARRLWDQVVDLTGGPDPLPRPAR